MVSASPSPTLEFYGTLSPIPGTRVDMTSPIPNQLSMPPGMTQQDESMVVRLQTPTEVGAILFYYYAIILTIMVVWPPGRHTCRL